MTPAYGILPDRARPPHIGVIRHAILTLGSGAVADVAVLEKIYDLVYDHHRAVFFSFFCSFSEEEEEEVEEENER